MERLGLKILKKGRSFYYLLFSFMAVLFLCCLVIGGQFILSSYKNFSNTESMYEELAQQAMNSISSLVSDVDTYEDTLRIYTQDSLSELSLLSKEEFRASDLADFHHLYQISYNLTNQIPGNAAYLYFKNSDYLMGNTTVEDIRETGEFDMLGISFDDWQQLINASKTPVTFIQKTDQMNFSRLFIAREIEPDVIFILAFPEGQLSAQMERHYLPEDSHVLMITENDQFVMSGNAEDPEKFSSLSWETLEKDTDGCISFHNESYYLYTQKITDASIKLAVLIPDILRAQLMHSLKVTFPVLFLIWLICGGCISWFFAVRLYRPVIFLLRNLPFQDYSDTQKNDLTRIHDLVNSLLQKNRSYEEKLNTQRELLADSLFVRLLNHSLEWNEDVKNALAEGGFPIHADKYLVFVISALPADDCEGNDDPLSVLESLSFRSTLKNTWAAQGYSSYISLSGGYFVGFVHSDKSLKVLDLKKIPLLLPLDSAITLCVAVSAPHSSMSELPLAYSEALQAADHMMLETSLQPVCFYSDLKRPEPEKQNQFLASVQLLSNYIQSANFDAAQKELKNICLLLGTSSTSSQTFQRSISYLIQTVNIAADSIRPIDTQKFADLQKQFPMSDRSSVSKLYQQIEQFLSYLPSCLLSDNNEEELLNQITSYIKENYADPSLSAGAVAERFHVSISWLSIHFKSRTGIGFLDYLHGYRLAKAKELLYSTNINIKEIALMTGYTNSATFSRAFSRYEGVTPSWYRSSRQKSEQF